MVKKQSFCKEKNQLENPIILLTLITCMHLMRLNIMLIV